MKLALGKRGKLLLLVGITSMLALVGSLYLGLRRDFLQEDFDNIQVGMTQETARSILNQRMHASHFNGYDNSTMVIVFIEQDSPLLPAGVIALTVDGADLVVDKSIHHPSMAQIGNHWKRQLGL